MVERTTLDGKKVQSSAESLMFYSEEEEEICIKLDDLRLKGNPDFLNHGTVQEVFIAYNKDKPITWETLAMFMSAIMNVAQKYLETELEVLYNFGEQGLFPLIID